MPFFRRSGGDEREARSRAQSIEAASLDALAQGALPLRAQQRLEEIGKAASGFFTSDLSVDEFALVHSLGLRPISQVMGSSVYHVGWQQQPGFYGGRQPGGVSQELTVVSEAWNTARLRAFSRLEQEAKLVGADAVVGVHVTKGAHDWAAGAIEYVAVGTAVRADGVEPTERPALSDLSGQDTWKLWQAGYRPLGVVGASTVHYVIPGWSTQQASSYWSSWANQELGDFTRGVYDARETALGRMTAEARKIGAAGVVGVSIEHSAEERETETIGARTVGSRRTDLVVTFHVIGTAIGERRVDADDLTVSPRIELRKNSVTPHVLGGNR
jgi:uncharacterized protein YbjQ (UPF0145 family)